MHFGEDITVFSKSIVKNYGPLRFKSENVLEDNGVLECRQVGKFANG